MKVPGVHRIVYGFVRSSKPEPIQRDHPRICFQENRNHPAI